MNVVVLYFRAEIVSKKEKKSVVVMQSNFRVSLKLILNNLIGNTSVLETLLVRLSSYELLCHLALFIYLSTLLFSKKDRQN